MIKLGVFSYFFQLVLEWQGLYEGSDLKSESVFQPLPLSPPELRPHVVLYTVQTERVLKYYYNITLNRSKKIRFLALSTKYIL